MSLILFILIFATYTFSIAEDYNLSDYERKDGVLDFNGLPPDHPAVKKAYRLKREFKSPLGLHQWIDGIYYIDMGHGLVPVEAARKFIMADKYKKITP